MFRGELATLAIRPKLPAERSLTGAPNTTRLNGFDISIRNCSVARSVNFVSLKTPKDSVLKLGWRWFKNTGAFPNVSEGGGANASRLRKKFTFESKFVWKMRRGAPVGWARTPPLNTKLLGL